MQWTLGLDNRGFCLFWNSFLMWTKVGVINVCYENDLYHHPCDIIITSQMAVSEVVVIGNIIVIYGSLVISFNIISAVYTLCMSPLRPYWQRIESRRGWLEFNPMSISGKSGDMYTKKG